MSFKIIYKKNYRPDESFCLLKKGFSHEENDLGFAKEKYLPVQKIYGIVQKSQVQQIDFKGEESNPAYTGYFLPNFIINTNEVRIIE